MSSSGTEGESFMAKLLLHYFKKSLCYLATGSTALFIAACYGPRISYYGTWNLTIRDAENKPVKGLTVKPVCMYTKEGNNADTLGCGVTDENGMVNLQMASFTKGTPDTFVAVIQGASQKETDIDTAVSTQQIKPTEIVLDITR
jgi:hypothetical protein